MLLTGLLPCARSLHLCLKQLYWMQIASRACHLSILCNSQFSAPPPPPLLHGYGKASSSSKRGCSACMKSTSKSSSEKSSDFLHRTPGDKLSVMPFGKGPT